MASIFSRAWNAVKGAITGRPTTPPVEPVQPVQPVTQGTYEPPFIPTVTPTPEQTMGLPPEGTVVPPSDMLPGDVPTGEVTDWSGYGAEFTIYDPDTYDPIPTDRLMTAEDWYRESLMPANYLRDRYEWSDKGLERPNIEILRQLEADDYFIDWEVWRAEYEAAVSG